MMKKGKVYLVGAGPGDPGLITVKAIDCLKKAEVVIYDYLANEKFLEYVPQKTEIIYVGKKGGAHTKTQEEINNLLVEKGKKQLVVRLKGGDPFVFGRGGEEAEVLHEEGIEFEIVPGVTSAIAVPAYAGIPLSHRGYASSIAFVTGHERSGQVESRINWSGLARGTDTQVFLMGMKNLPNIVRSLKDEGIPGDTPAALIQWGTTNSQKTAVGNLDTIEEKAKEAQISSPVIIVFGKVIELRSKLNWFETKPLFGKTVLVTRAREQASEFKVMLENSGANCLVFPTISIVPPDSWDPLDSAISNLDEYDWLVFTSVNGVKYFFKRLFLQNKDVRALKGIQLCAIGPKTAGELKKRFLRIDYVPSEYRAEAVIRGLGEKDITGKKILLPRALVAREVLPEKLRTLGAQVDEIPAYKTVLPESPSPEIKESLLSGEVDCITFTSSSTVRNFTRFFSAQDVKSVKRKIAIACIGPITADTAKEKGYDVDIIPGEYTLEALTEAVIDYFKIS